MFDFKDIFVQPFEDTKPVKALVTAIEKHEDDIMDLNRQQLDRGLDANGDSLGKYKNFKYKNRFQPVDLKLTNDFRRKFTLQSDEKQTIIFSQDEKAPWLEKRYGEDINGIPSSMIPNMQELIEDDFVNQYSKQLLK
jgi:hypothetical protein